ncbi:MAG: hypothetical protein HYZ53_25105 [Planctomycetes bacterium]|nr:hypothetical protein [Planctomycetota bacterium]
MSVRKNGNGQGTGNGKGGVNGNFVTWLQANLASLNKLVEVHDHRMQAHDARMRILEKGLKAQQSYLKAYRAEVKAHQAEVKAELEAHQAEQRDFSRWVQTEVVESRRQTRELVANLSSLEASREHRDAAFLRALQSIDQRVQRPETKEES